MSPVIIHVKPTDRVGPEDEEEAQRRGHKLVRDRRHVHAHLVGVQFVKGRHAHRPHYRVSC